MYNSAFGKTTENIIKHKDIRLVTNRESYLKTVTKPNFKSEIYFSENLMSCKMGKTKVKYAGGGVQPMENCIRFSLNKHLKYLIF